MTTIIGYISRQSQTLLKEAIFCLVLYTEICGYEEVQTNEVSTTNRLESATGQDSGFAVKCNS
jgi:hypothetical protein